MYFQRTQSPTHVRPSELQYRKAPVPNVWMRIVSNFRNAGFSGSGRDQYRPWSRCGAFFVVVFGTPEWLGSLFLIAATINYTLSEDLHRCPL